MRVGLLLNNQQSDQGMLDLQEIRDMLLFTRVSYIPTTIPHIVFNLLYFATGKGGGR
jgi:hypothetical protein